MRDCYLAIAPALVLALLSTVSSERTGALLVFTKSLRPSRIVEGRNVSVVYEVHNIGRGIAKQVSLKDNAFPQSWYKIYSGTFRKTWETIAPGSSVSLKVIAKALKSGELNVNVPSIRYQEEDGTRRVTKLDAASTVNVEDIISYKRRTDKHVLDWIVYAAGSAALTTVPYFAYTSKLRTLIGKGMKKRQ